ncbi:hypothetical protein [Bradyrhizobium sp. LA6.12]|uniref:hypothetical protein n=1 Tax=unclassified Bradyrhizobium TaxID=2631580 RepID=UPI0033980B0F
MTRWEALVRYDPEIREAATKLIVFGESWVDRLGEAFLALNEERKYLADMVDQLIKEAEQYEVAAWLKKFARTQEGEATSEEAMTILANAQANGYQLSTEPNGTIQAMLNSSTTYLRSNADIVRFGKFMKK